MQLSGPGRHRIYVEHDRVHRSRNRNIACSEQGSVEVFSILFVEVDSFDLVDPDVCVEPHVAEMIPVDASVHTSGSIEPVPYAYVIEIYTAVIDMELTVRMIWYIRVFYPQQAVVKPCAFAVFGQVRQWTVQRDLS